MSILPNQTNKNENSYFFATEGGGGGSGSLDASQFVFNSVTFSGLYEDFNPSSTFQIILPITLFPTGNKWYEVSFNFYCGSTIVEDTTATTCSIVVYNNDPNYTYPASYHQLIVSNGSPFNATCVKSRVFIGTDPGSYDVVIEVTNQGQNNTGNIVSLNYNIDGISALCLGSGTVISPP